MATSPSTAVIPIRQQLRTAPFLEWTYDDAHRALEEKVPQDFNVLVDYCVNKDHYRDGQEWVGPGTASSTGKIAQQFAPEDAVGQVLSNISNAFEEPQIGAVPIDDLPEGAEVPEPLKNKIFLATTLLSNWFDKQRLQEHIQERQETTAWAGYADLRVFVPWRFLDKIGESVTIRRARSFKEAMTYIYLTAPMPNVCGTVVDSGTQDLCGIHLDKEIVRDPSGQTNEYDRAELVFLDPNRIVDEDADTIIRVVYSDPNKAEITTRVKLGGRLLAAEMESRIVITDPVIRTQRQLNLLCTLVTRLGETAAFPERYTKNARPQGVRIPYEDGDSLGDGAFIERDGEGREWAVIPQERTLGANTTTELIGLPQYDDKGDAKGNQMPDVLRFDPIDPKPYLEAADSVRRRILRMCSQGHLGGISNAEASGIAYEQARAVFEKDLNKRRVAEEGMLRELLTGVLALAEQIMGQPGFFTKVIRVTVDQHIDAGPRSPDLVRLDLESYDAGVLSRETTMARIGVEDINAELIRVRRSAQYILDVIEQVSKAGEVFSAESLIEVLKELNVPSEIVGMLKPAPLPTPAPGAAQ
jgi:hypothetical protein